MTLLPSVFLLASAMTFSQPTAVDYMREVKPILAGSCYACHGAIKQKGGLRVDTVQFMKEGGDNGSTLIAGKPDDSPLLKHVLGMKGFKRMPPAAEGEALKPAQIATIRRWIEQGAVGPKDERAEADPREHWAFRPPVRPAVPKNMKGNPIDAFLAVAQEKHGLTPQGSVERSLLLRRVYLDLIGLPPTREEMQAFLADMAPDAYEKVVDRLLASPHHGERWGRHWMDIWRYSDWWGLGAELRNSQRHIWHWRDWIVDSLNRDKGYDQMLREMLAADELYPTDDDALRGTGFLARHYFLFNRTTWLDETIEHTSKAFMGLTFNCCKCHDHKYDAISQVDYYRFRALFEPYGIRTDLVPGETDIMKNGVPRVYDANLDMTTPFHIRGNENVADKTRKIAPGLPSLLIPAGLQFQRIKLPVEAHQPGLRLAIIKSHLHAAEMQLEAARKELAEARLRLALAPKKPEQKPMVGKPQELFRDTFVMLEKSRWEVAAGDWQHVNGKLVQHKIGANRGVLRLRESPPIDFEACVKFATLGGDTYRSVGIAFDVDGDHEAMIYLTPHAPSRVQVSYKLNGKNAYPKEGSQSHVVALKETNDIVLRVRGTLLNVSVNGRAPLVYRLPIARRAGKLELITYDASARFDEFTLSTLPADVAMIEGIAKATGAPVTQAQAKAAITVAEKKIAHAEAMIAAVNARSHADRVIASGGDVSSAKKAAALAEKQLAVALAEWTLARVEAGDGALKLSAAQAKAAIEIARKALANPGDTYTPIVGSVKTKEHNTETDANRLKPFPKESTGRRAALAKWLTERQNPLAARVAVNHIWARHFGQPIVATVFDFGRKGAAPSHPELLDWLAVEMMESRWSMKQIHRLIVTSNAYRMTTSSLGVAEKNLKADPDNKYYWRMNTGRMESQIVRDSLFHLAGELDTALGGPSVEIAAQDASKRRSIYFFHSAIDRNKFLTTFDEADPLDCYRRRESIIPQQAFALYNSKLSITMADKIATQLEKTVAPKAFARDAFTWLLGYAPTPNELDACESAMARWLELNKLRPDAAHRARAQLVQALLNHSDFITIR